jgi:hypothetical protein
LRLIGQGKVGDTPVQHSALPADDLMQAFLYRHLVTARDFKVCVSGRGSPSRSLQNGVLHLTAGGEARLQIASAAIRSVGNIRVELNEAPEGITVKRARSTRDGLEVVLACDAAKSKPGLQGNLILSVFAERPTTKSGKAGKQAQRSSLGTMPAVPFEVVAASGKRST